MTEITFDTKSAAQMLGVRGHVLLGMVRRGKIAPANDPGTGKRFEKRFAKSEIARVKQAMRDEAEAAKAAAEALAAAKAPRAKAQPVQADDQLGALAIEVARLREQVEAMRVQLAEIHKAWVG